MNGSINDILNMMPKSNTEYLIEAGYSTEQSNILASKLSSTSINYLTTAKKDDRIVSLVDHEYFIENRFTRYIDLLRTNKNSINEIISLVNANRDYEYYTNVVKTDTSYNYLMISNKYYQLESTYTPNDLVKLTYGVGSLRRDAYDAFIKMSEDAANLDLKLYSTSSYRSFETQTTLYDRYVKQDSIKEADTYSARAGHSEHQTGLAVDIISPTTDFSNFETSDEFMWLKDNAHLYGYILRYPKDKEHLTGYIYEPWHYRYIGKEDATKLYESNLTFDEYYAFYIDKK